MSQFASHGRGGAGNMVDSTQSPKIKPTDLETPTLKTPIVTTGRGGSGNMARNDDPAETRWRQDVQSVPRRPSHGAQHGGRGGAGNVLKANHPDAVADGESGNDDKPVFDDSDASSANAKTDETNKHNSLAGKPKGWRLGAKS